MPYPIFRTTKLFETIHPIVFAINIKKSKGYFDALPYHNDLFEFSFQPENGVSLTVPKDERIRKTVVETVSKWFDQNNRLLYYVCCDANGQGRHRKIAFSKWFNEENGGQKYAHLQIDLNDPVKNSKTHFGLLFRYDYENSEAVLSPEDDVVSLFQRLKND